MKNLLFLMIVLLSLQGCYALKPMPQFTKFDSVEQRDLYRQRQHDNWYRK